MRRVRQFTVYIDEEIIEMVNSLVENIHIDRSAFIERMLIEYFDKIDEKQETARAKREIL